MTKSYSFQEVIVALPLGKLILRLYSWEWYEKDPALINSRFANLFSKYVDQARVYLLPRSQGVKAWSSDHWNVIWKDIIGRTSHEIFVKSSIPPLSPQKNHYAPIVHSISSLYLSQEEYVHAVLINATQITSYNTWWIC